MSRSNKKSGDAYWRTELVYVEKYWDDLWLGVKG